MIFRCAYCIACNGVVIHAKIKIRNRNIYCNFRAYLQNRYMRYNMYSGRPCENSLQRKRVEGRTSIYTKILRKLWLIVHGIYTCLRTVF
jgi:hypothetical protein